MVGGPDQRQAGAEKNGSLLFLCSPPGRRDDGAQRTACGEEGALVNLSRFGKTGMYCHRCRHDAVWQRGAAHSGGVAAINAVRYALACREDSARPGAAAARRGLLCRPRGPRRWSMRRRGRRPARRRRPQQAAAPRCWRPRNRREILAAMSYRIRFAARVMMKIFRGYPAR